MSDQKPKVKPVKLICAITFNPNINLEEVISKLAIHFGSIDKKSHIFDFIHTNYYLKEMGKDLKKIFISFSKLVMPNLLAQIKNDTNRIESFFTTAGNRNVNIDPGYIEESKLVLASTKNFSHRIYIGESIWAEVTLSYQNNKFVTHPWTYPDYAENDIKTFLDSVRDLYRKQLKK